MSFSRYFSLTMYPKGELLTEMLAGIGFRLGANPNWISNIEDVLIAAAIEGMEGDFRILSLLVDWFEIHSKRVNVDRLYRALTKLENLRVKAFFASIGILLKKDPRFKKLKQIYRKEKIFLGLTKEYDYLLKRNGEDERFKNTFLLVAKKTLRKRIEDILSPEDLAKNHRGYYYRVLVGPSYRADMLTLAEQNPEISTSDLAKQAYGSFATAWSVKSDLALIRFKTSDNPKVYQHR